MEDWEVAFNTWYEPDDDLCYESERRAFEAGWYAYSGTLAEGV